MKKYFVLSDIHGFYTEMKQSLWKAGFRKTNKEHILIICGDIFDRGDEALKVYYFIKSLPKYRRILIRGNHEDLFLSLLNKEFPGGHDFHNCTVDTFCQIARNHYIEEGIKMSDYLDIDSDYYSEEELQEKHSLWEDIRNKVADSEVAKWLKSDEWLDYYELDKFIFVHSFIPTETEDWRTLPSNFWGRYHWGCPWEQYQLGHFKKEEDAGKVLVCGHWHTAEFYEKLDNNYSFYGSVAPIYFSKHLIGIDGGCNYNGWLKKFIHPQNILIIDGNLNCYDESGKRLETN